jgi:hypothetical protein
MTAAARPRPRRLFALFAALAGLAAAALLVLGPAARPAGAHEGDAVLVVEGVHPAGRSIHYIVRVTWADDGHPAEAATVTATGITPDGTQLTPVALAPADEDGRYSGAVEYPAPGAWTVRITSIDPTGTIEQPQEVTATATTASPEGTAGSEDTSGFAPADDGTGGSAEGGVDGDEQAAGDDGDGDDSGMPLVLIVVAALVVVGGAVTALRLILRTRAHPPAGTAGDGGGPEPPASAATTPGAAGSGDDATPR